jgi:hypothetical protein
MDTHGFTAVIAGASPVDVAVAVGASTVTGVAPAGMAYAVFRSETGTG